MGGTPGGVDIEGMVARSLSLGDEWKVVRAECDAKAGRVLIGIAETGRLWAGLRCPRCNQPGVRCYDHVGPLKWRHLNVFTYECLLECALPRGKCPGCGHLFRVAPPWEGRSSHFTREFETYALLLAKNMPTASAAGLLGEHDTRLFRIIETHVEAARAAQDWSFVSHVGADETSVRKGHNYLTVFVDLKEKRVLYAAEGKDAATWAGFAKELAAHKGAPGSVTHASMDMSPAYTQGVTANFPDARIVYDKFHVIMNASDAVDKVRRAEQKSGSEEAREDLKQSRWLWLKNEGNLTDKERARLKAIDKSRLATGKAYELKVALQDVYDAPDAESASDRMMEWCEWAESEARENRLLAPFEKVANMIASHFEGVMAHFSSRLTNGFLECLNSLFSGVKRCARGFRNIERIKTVLYFRYGKLPLPCH